MRAGLSQLAAGDLHQAASSFRQALALKPDLADAHSHLGVALQALDRHDEALQHCETAFALQPDDVGVLNNFGNALLALDRPQEAIARYEQALALAPQLAEPCESRECAARGQTARGGAPALPRGAGAQSGFCQAHMISGIASKRSTATARRSRAARKALAIEPGYRRPHEPRQSPAGAGSPRKRSKPTRRCLRLLPPMPARD